MFTIAEGKFETKILSKNHFQLRIDIYLQHREARAISIALAQMHRILNMIDHTQILVLVPFV